MVVFEYSSQAVDWVENADNTAREQVQSKVETIRSNSRDHFYNPEHFLEPYTNSPYYKIKAGQYRLVVDWRRRDDGEDVFFIRRIGHRDGFYSP
jgi:mRNA interferase RelE/StbE